MRNRSLYGWDFLLALTRWSSCSVLVFMVLTICYDSFMRSAELSPTNWSMEINSFLIVYLALVGAAEVQMRDSHIRITFFIDRMSPWVKMAAARLGALLGAVFCVILAWRGGIIAYNSFEYGERVSSSFGTPLAYPYAIIPIGFGLLAAEFLILLFGGRLKADAARGAVC